MMECQPSLSTRCVLCKQKVVAAGSYPRWVGCPLPVRRRREWAGRRRCVGGAGTIPPRSLWGGGAPTVLPANRGQPGHSVPDKLLGELRFQLNGHNSSSGGCVGGRYVPICPRCRDHREIGATACRESRAGAVQYLEEEGTNDNDRRRRRRRRRRRKGSED